MKKLLATIGMIASAQIAHASNCGDLGLSNPYLAEHFCTQLTGIAGTDEATRSINDGTDTDGSEALLPEWSEYEILQDAYRADPKKTLELIARIKKAGGLSTN